MKKSKKKLKMTTLEKYQSLEARDNLKTVSKVIAAMLFRHPGIIMAGHSVTIDEILLMLGGIHNNLEADYEEA